MYRDAYYNYNASNIDPISGQADAVSRKDFAAAASVTSHAPPGNDVMYQDAYYTYAASRAPAPPNVAAFGMHEKLLEGNGSGSIFQHTGFRDPGSPMRYSASLFTLAWYYQRLLRTTTRVQFNGKG